MRSTRVPIVATKPPPHPPLRNTPDQVRGTLFSPRHVRTARRRRPNCPLDRLRGADHAHRGAAIVLKAGKMAKLGRQMMGDDLEASHRHYPASGRSPRVRVFATAGKSPDGNMQSEFMPTGITPPCQEEWRRGDDRDVVAALRSSRQARDDYGRARGGRRLAWGNPEWWGKSGGKSGALGRSEEKFLNVFMVLRERIELSASPLPRECSTTELPQQIHCATRPGGTSRTRDDPSSRPAREAQQRLVR